MPNLSATRLAKSGCELPCMITISEADVESMSLRQRFGGRTLPNLEKKPMKSILVDDSLEYY